MIPSESSEYISFGEVTETAAFNDFNDRYDCKYIKRKKVRWFKTLNRDSLDPNLYKLMFSHHTISSADQYAEYIDKILSSFFIKDNKAHVVLRVNSENVIKARSLFALGDLTLDLLDEFSKEENVNVDSDGLEVKMAVQSPGFIELSGTNIAAIVITGIIVVLIVGGGIKLKIGSDFDLSMKSDGLIERIRKFLSTNNKAKRKKELLQEYMKDLELEDPKDLVKILKELNKE